MKDYYELYKEIKAVRLVNLVIDLNNSRLLIFSKHCLDISFDFCILWWSLYVLNFNFEISIVSSSAYQILIIAKLTKYI